MLELLRYEVRAAILRPATFAAVGARRPFFAIGDGAETVSRDAELGQEFLRRGGAAIAEAEVVFGGTTLVAMALDRQRVGGELAEDGLQRVRVFS